MVSAKPDSTQHPHASSSASAPPSAEEEALKRNTDCVYFLASPLTCKKGSECEYRHSDYARVNPRDCWYWLNGSCLNPKCPFRHPPLDGLLETQAVAAPLPPPPHGAVFMPPTAPVPAPYGSGKQAVPCIFFQKGYCMKGDQCAFSHGTNPIGNKLQQPPAPLTTSSKLSSLKKPSGSLGRCSQQPKITPKPIVPQSAPKLVPGSGKNLPVNVIGVEKLARSKNEETPRYEPSIPPAVIGRHDRSILHDKETEDFLRESSPGFDVLVDDEVGDADYYHGEDQYRRTIPHEQYDMDGPADYSSLPDIDHRMVGWEQRRNSSDQMVAYSEGRGYPQSETPDLDLRHRLSKQRRVNGLRSVVSSDFVPEGSVDERSSSRQRLPSHEGSSRLKGRLRFPERSGTNGNGLHRDREMDRGRDNNNRLRGRVDEHYSGEDRGLLGHPPRMRREFVDGNGGDFSGPKSLTELKTRRQLGGSTIKQQQNPLSFVDQQGDADVSFEGPKPLSLLLKKRKRVDDSDSGLNGKDRAAELHYSAPTKEEEKAEIGDMDKEDDRMVEEETTEQEGDDQVGAGGYEYEQVDEEKEYNYDGENAEEEEYLDEEDDNDDDFAKKVGVMFS